LLYADFCENVTIVLRSYKTKERNLFDYTNYKFATKI